MSRLLRAPTLALLAVALPAVAKEPKTVHVTWRFENVVPGYDHTNRLVVIVNGEIVARSRSFQETETGTIDFVMPKGAKRIGFVSQALYEGTWEDHTKQNDYSVDCVWGTKLKGKLTAFDLVCDIDAGATGEAR